jgi:hypothetical protein
MQSTKYRSSGLSLQQHKFEVDTRNFLLYTATALISLRMAALFPGPGEKEGVLSSNDGEELALEATEIKRTHFDRHPTLLRLTRN